MGPSMTQYQVTRVWTVEMRLATGDPVVTCSQCGPVPVAPRAAALRTATLTHLARHARNEALTPHLRTCRCGEHGCRWHPRHRGCSGSLVLLLTRVARGWRLADVCRACAAATEHAAVVPECGDPQLLSADPAAAEVATPRSNDALADHMSGNSDSLTGVLIYEDEPVEQGLWYADGLVHD